MKHQAPKTQKVARMLTGHLGEQHHQMEGLADESGCMQERIRELEQEKEHDKNNKKGKETEKE